MSQRKDRFATTWHVVESPDAVTVVDGEGTIVSRTCCRVEGDSSSSAKMSREQAREIAERMVAAGEALAPLSKGTTHSDEMISTLRRAR